MNLSNFIPEMSLKSSQLSPSHHWPHPSPSYHHLYLDHAVVFSLPSSLTHLLLPLSHLTLQAKMIYSIYKSDSIRCLNFFKGFWLILGFRPKSLTGSASSGSSLLLVHKRHSSCPSVTCFLHLLHMTHAPDAPIQPPVLLVNGYSPLDLSPTFSSSGKHTGLFQNARAFSVHLH